MTNVVEGFKRINQQLICRKGLSLLGSTCISASSRSIRSQCLQRGGVQIPQTRLFNWSTLLVPQQTRIIHSSSSHRSQEPASSPTPTPPPKRRGIITKLAEREDITNIPNLLTISRLLATPAIGYFIINDNPGLAVGLLAYASITDWVDGYIARNYNMQTVIGTVLDPMADKILMTTLTVCLAWKGALPIWVAGIILGRDVGMGLAAFYFRWISLPPPKTLTRYFDFSLPSIEVKPTMISKVNTALQLLLLGTCTAHPLFTTDITTALTAFEYLVATTTVWSGLSYVYGKDTIRIINDQRGGGDKETEL